MCVPVVFSDSLPSVTFSINLPTTASLQPGFLQWLQKLVPQGYILTTE